MICPVCQKAMIVVEHHQIELDYCTSCQGVWFDSGELELLLESAKLESQNLTIKNILSLPEVKLSPKRRKCPICHQNMRETAIGQPAINIDVCRRGDGLWFDGGELRELLSQMVSKPSAGAGTDQHILDFLGEVFKVPE
jgi:Zn-finger nucleic acid-binding protein